MRKIAILPRRCDPRARPPLRPAASASRAPPPPKTSGCRCRSLQAKVEARATRSRKAKLKNACGELYTLDKNGNRVELFVDPTNGQIIGQM